MSKMSEKATDKEWEERGPEIYAKAIWEQNSQFPLPVNKNRMVVAYAMALKDIRKQAMLDAANIAENGRFLSEDAPDYKFGKACGAAIRRQAEELT